MDDWEEHTCRLCNGLAGLYFRRENMIARGETEKAQLLEEPIRILLEDIKNWLLKNDNQKG